MKTRILILLSFLIVVAFTTPALAQGIHITPVDTIWPDTTTDDTRVTALSSLGDINGDGFEDLGVCFSSSWSESRNSSKIIIYFGNTMGTFDNTWEYYFPNESLDGLEWFGPVTIINTIGDVNNDGWKDLALGMSAYSWDWTYEVGRSWIFYSGPLMDTIPDWQWTVNYYIYYHYFGQEIHDAGDWNDDGYDDFAVSAPWNDSGGEGDVYLILGGNPPDTSFYMSWHGIEIEEHLDCIGSADIDYDGKKVLFIINNSGYWADTMRSDTISINLFKRSVIDCDTLLGISLPNYESNYYELESFRDDSCNFIFSIYQFRDYGWVPDTFLLFSFKFEGDTFAKELINIRDIISCYDTNLVPFFSHLNLINDVNGDLKHDILCELCYSIQTGSGYYVPWRTGRMLILDPHDDFRLIYLSDPLFEYGGKITVLDFNGDGKDEVFVGNTAFHEDEYGVLVFTTGDWEGIEEQKEITHQNSLAGSFGNTIHFDVNISARAEIDLFDITGRKIREEAIDVHKGCNSISFGKLNSGIYLYRIRFNETDEIMNGKLVNIN